MGILIKKTSNTSEEKKLKKITGIKYILIIALSAIICGLLAYFITDALINKKPKEEPTPEVVEYPLDISDSNVQTLYSYVMYSPKGIRGEKFISESNVTLDTFSNQEKYFYALQFVQNNDFTPIGVSNNKNQYLIKLDTIDTYMKRFFGDSVEYNTSDIINHIFSFDIDEKNVADMTYSAEKEGFITVFERHEDIFTNNDLVQPYYSKLMEATQKKDGSYELVENIIYTGLESNSDGTYNISIYKDYQKNSLIRMKSSLSEEDLNEYMINIDDYKDSCSKITYTFKPNEEGVLYFDNSVIN